ncbi:hypothetical protein BC833DRAFT_618387 [Globomyces pollinis-pini]|nr:hypothetical protein BC833DRAFT_618387 [Globomyces pollinis-pini]
MDQLAPYIHQANEQLSNVPFLVLTEKTTRIPKVYQVAAVYVLYSISIFFHIYAGLTTFLVCFSYPVIQFLSSYEKNDNETLKKWGLYLVISTFWTFMELGIYEYVPYYYVFKSISLVYLAGEGMDAVSGLLAPHIHLAFADDSKKIN